MLHRNTGTAWDDDQELNSHPNAIIPMSDDEVGYFEMLGARTETVLERFFTVWGTYCASKPWLILFLGFCFVVGMGHGIKYLNITTNPVELWASPNSRARLERDHFDQNFEPFYRIEQIIIKAVDLPTLVHNTSDGPIEFGPVFQREFLLQLFDLQQRIKGKFVF